MVLITLTILSNYAIVTWNQALKLICGFKNSIPHSRRNECFAASKIASFHLCEWKCIVCIQFRDWISISFFTEQEKHIKVWKKERTCNPHCIAIHMYVCTPNANEQIQFFDIVTKSVKLLLGIDSCTINNSDFVCAVVVFVFFAR